MAGVAELVDALDLESSEKIRESSSLSIRNVKIFTNRKFRTLC